MKSHDKFRHLKSSECANFMPTLAQRGHLVNPSISAGLKKLTDKLLFQNKNIVILTAVVAG